MAYRFSSADASLQEGLRRIAGGQLARAIDMTGNGGDVSATVHEVRRRCKKLRGLLRLVRPAFPSYACENAALREAAGLLSHMRDRTVLVTTFDALVAAPPGVAEAEAFTGIRNRLTTTAGASTSDDPAERIGQCRQILMECADRASFWSLERGGFAAIGDGLAKTYKDGRKAMRAARGEPDAERLHEWRKQAKYHWYHMRLIAPARPEEIELRAEAAHALLMLLGEHHDLAVLSSTVEAEREEMGPPAPLDDFKSLLKARQGTVERDAFSIGRRLYGEPPPVLRQRMKAYWKAWQSNNAG